MENQKPEALRLAEWCEENSPSIYRQSAETAKELRRLHARIQELEAMLESIGAGGVSAQRVRQEDGHIAQDRKMAPVTVVLPEPVAAQTRLVGGSTNWTTVSLFHAKSLTGGAYELRYLHTEQQVRELLAKDLDAVNLDRLGKALTKLGHATWVSQEAAAADIPRWVNALTSCVLEIPEAAPQPQADARDAERVDALYTALEVCSAELFAQCAHQGRAMKYVEQARKALAAEQCARAAIAAAKGAQK